MIDSHVHFWNLDRGDYTWITDARPALARDFGVEDFLSASQVVDVVGCVAVQAAATQTETAFLLELATHNDCILAVTGWTDLTAETVPQDLQDLAKHPKLRAIRPMAGVQKGPEWLDTPDYHSGFAAMEQCGLVLEALALPGHLCAIASIARSYPNLKIVVNHAAKPNPYDLSPWQHDIETFAELKNTLCKVSGFTAHSRDFAHHQSIFETLIEVFGPDRLMWGSDFPVLNETSNYINWFCTTKALMTGLNEGDTAKIMRLTAQKTYL